MNAKELSQMLSGRECMSGIGASEAAQAKADGLVVVYGYSDDNMEFQGAICDEVSCYVGGTAYVTKAGVLPEPNCGMDDCPFHAAALAAAKPIQAVWHDEGGPCWTFETGIPHETFNIYEGGELFCRGIVFSVADL